MTCSGCGKAGYSVDTCRSAQKKDKPQGNKNSNRPVCNFCKCTEHLESSYWARNASKASDTKPSERPVCNFCKHTGHLESSCWNKNGCASGDSAQPTGSNAKTSDKPV